MTQMEEVSVESILRCSRANKTEILVALLRERMAERQLPFIPFTIKDEKGELVGAFHPDPGKWERSKTPPPMSPEERKQLEHALQTLDDSFTFEEFLESMEAEERRQSEG